MSGTKESVLSKKAFLNIGVVLAWSFVCVCTAADQTHTNSLENYLKRLGYEPIPFRYEKNAPLVDGQINGKKCVFLLDTGCTISQISSELVKGAKTITDLSVTIEDPIVNALTNLPIVLMEKVSLGRAEFMNQPAQRTKIDADFVQLNFDGVLGLDFLSRNNCLIDCAAERFYVRGQKPTDGVAKALDETLSRSGFTNVNLYGDAYIAADTRVNGASVRMIVDTGGKLSQIDESQTKRLGLHALKNEYTGSHIPAEMEYLTVGFGDIGAHKTKVVKVNSLQLAGVEWRALYFGSVDMGAWRIDDKDGKRPFYGILAPDTLAPQDTLIDLPARKLWFAQKAAVRKHGW